MIKLHFCRCKLYMDNYKVCFIICHKYYRNRQNYIEYYVQNINKFYEQSLILIVDNNSTFIDDIIEILQPYNNVKILINDGECKFEIGAYKKGLKYIVDNDLLNEYDYYVCVQDSYILKNKYDFNIMKNENITACSLCIDPLDICFKSIKTQVLSKIGLFNNMNKAKMCFCSSFILHKDKVKDFYNYVYDIIIKIRSESEAGERYLGRIILELNDFKVNSVDGYSMNLTYNRLTVDPLEDSNYYFVKRFLRRNETTTDI